MSLLCPGTEGLWITPSPGWTQVLSCSVVCGVLDMLLSSGEEDDL